MFVRFRRSRHRLVVSLIESRRVNGGVVSEHVAALGSVALPEPVGPRERVRFWRELKNRWLDLVERMGNRVTAEDRRRAVAAIHARIPKPSLADHQAARIERQREDIASLERGRGEADCLIGAQLSSSPITGALLSAPGMAASSSSGAWSMRCAARLRCRTA
jgi:hypothetical protein